MKERMMWKMTAKDRDLSEVTLVCFTRTKDDPLTRAAVKVLENKGFEVHFEDLTGYDHLD